MGKLIGFAAFLALLSALAYVGMTGAFRADMITFGDVFGYLKYLTPAMLGLGGLSLLLGLIGFFSGRGGAGLFAVLMGIAALGCASGPMMMRMQAEKVPAIHDISTDTRYPPVFVDLVDIRTADGATNPAEYDAEQADQQREAYDLQTLTTEAAYEDVFAAAIETLEEMGLEIVATEENAGRIEATATTPWWGFKDDVVVRVNRFSDPVEVDIRSKSRIGKSDLGANAKRIEKFLSKLDAKLN